jgi:periplasmic protein TonB
MSAFLPDPDLPSMPPAGLAASGAGQRRQYRPPIGIPIKKQRGLLGAIIAVLLHVLLVLVFIFPYFGIDVVGQMTGAGGAGPAGGGGGGRGGTGGGRVAQERITYVVPAPPPPTVESKFIQPPVVQPPPEVKPPEVKPPVETPPPVPATPEPAVSASNTTGPLSDVASATAGSGGGAGNDGSGGSGPGSGGGVGTGIGTGRGSGVGAGTGGGAGTIFPPTPSELFIPPVPVPDRVKGRTITIVFDVDSTGKVIDFELTPTRDAAYNRKLREILGATRFRPATDGNGRPVRAKYNLDYTF